MMNGIRNWGVVVLLFAVAGCGVISGTRGSGNSGSEDRKVSGFDSVSLNGSGRLLVDQNGTESLSITTDDNLLPLITSEVHGKQLVLSVREGSNIDPTKDVVFKVTAKNLNRISINGSASAEATGVHTDGLRLDIAGSGDITASGKSDRQDISIAGSGKYLGADLKTKTATINIAGSGDAVVAASDSLDVTIAGSGSIQYIGDPKITQSVLGSGSISRK